MKRFSARFVSVVLIISVGTSACSESTNPPTSQQISFSPPTTTSQPTSSQNPPTTTLKAPHPIFNWPPVAGASQYKFQLSTDPEFSSSTTTEKSISDSMINWPNDLLYSTTYYWRYMPIIYGYSGTTWTDPQTYVSEINSTQNPTSLPKYDYQNSIVVSPDLQGKIEVGFKDPIILMQKDGHITVHIHWAIKNTTNQILTSYSFLPIIKCQDGTFLYTTTLPSLYPIVKGAVAIKPGEFAEDPYWYYAFSPVFADKIKAGLRFGLTIQFVNFSDVPPSINNSTPTFQWFPWPNATNYEVQMSADPGFTTEITTKTTSTNSIIWDSLVQNQTRYFRLKPIDSSINLPSSVFPIQWRFP